MPWPQFDPENIAIALFNQLKTANYSFASSDRIGELPQNVPTAMQPYLGLIQFGASQVENQAQGLEKWLLHFRVVIYIRADAGPTRIGATLANAALLAIVKAMRAANIGERQTLGGLVDNAWINGDVLIDTGILDQQIAVLIPITVDVGI